MSWFGLVSSILSLLVILTRMFEERRWIAEGEAAATKRILGVLTNEVDDTVRRADDARASGVPNLKHRD